MIIQLFPAGNNVVSGLTTSLDRSGHVTGLVQNSALEFSAGSWMFVIGAVIWRGRMKTTWLRQGFSRELFKLFVVMRGATTRLNLMKALSAPKDRNQLAKELDCDWVNIDRQVRLLLRHNLLSEKIAFGNVKLYELSPSGYELLILLESVKESPDSRILGSTQNQSP